MGTLKLIIAGSRTIDDPEILVHCMAILKEGGQTPTQVVSGGSRGVDSLGEQWALANQIPVKQFPAYWSIHGNAAGPIRNGEMASYADALLAIWDGESRGTQNMIDQMVALHKPVYRLNLSKIP